VLHFVNDYEEEEHRIEVKEKGKLQQKKKKLFPFFC
jgi:hypothetical protein